MFTGLRARLNEAGLGYLSENNVLRYMFSYKWNMDTTFTKLSTCERWRTENGCMEVYKNEIIKELDMKVISYK